MRRQRREGEMKRRRQEGKGKEIAGREEGKKGKTKGRRERIKQSDCGVLHLKYLLIWSEQGSIVIVRYPDIYCHSS